MLQAQTRSAFFTDTKYIAGWLLVAAYFFYEVVIRVAPSVMVGPLSHDFALNEQQIGSLVSVYYFAFVAMQIPAGLLVDRFGPYKIIALSAALMGLGAVLFAHSTTIWMATLARIIMGCGASFILINCFKLLAIYFKPERHGLFVGLTGLFGASGGLEGQIWLAKLVGDYGWRQSMVALALVACGFMLVLWFLLPRKQEVAVQQEAATEESSSFFSTVKAKVLKPQFLMIAFYAGLMNAPIITFAALWGIPYVELEAHVSLLVATHIIAWVWIGQIPGYLAVNWLADFVSARKIMLVSSFGCLLSMSYVVFAPIAAHPVSLSIAMFFIGFLSSANFVSFALLCKLHSAKEVGTLNGFANMINLLVGAILQIIIGWLMVVTIQHFGVQSSAQLQGSQLAMPIFVMPAALLLAFMLAWFIRDN